MKIPSLLAIGLVLPAFADSFLTAQKFPKTFDDLSFQSRMEFYADDYELYRPEYDKDGFCVKNCAYPGLNIKQEEYITETDTENAINDSLEYQKQNTTSLPVNTQSIVNAVNTSYQVPSQKQCAGRNLSVPFGQKVPFGKPLIGNLVVTSPFGPRILEGKQSFHDGIDYAARVGTIVYAPADATVSRVINDARCGKGLMLKHPDGITTIYCHLSKTYLSKGNFVGAGCPIAESGNTGHSTGPHLHYGMLDKSGKKINPSSYTKRAS